MSDTEPAAITLGACRGGPTLAVLAVSGDLYEECARCGMLVSADQADDWVFGFKARCERKSKMTERTDEIWRGSTSLRWCADCFGRPGRALYAGGICVGNIQYAYGKASKPWRAWIMTNEDGDSIGWYASEQEAKDALADAVAKELCK